MKTLQQHRARPQRWLATLTIALLALGAPLATAAPAFAREALPALEQQVPAEQAPAEQISAEQTPAEQPAAADSPEAVEDSAPEAAPAPAPEVAPAPEAAAAPQVAVQGADAPVAAPTVTVSKTEGLNAAGETVTVTGTGFVAGDATSGARPPLAGKFAGSYVVFGRFADAWKPSENAASASRAGSGDTKWAVPAADMATIGGDAAGAIELNADGSFTATLNVTEEFAKNPGTGNYGIYTYSGSGAKAAQFETFTPITFAPKVVAPTVTVSKTEGLNAAGETVTVTGTGFVAGDATSGARPPLAGKFAGSYVVFGRFADAWKPSENAASASRAGSGDTKWAVPAADMGTIGGDAAGAIELNADGSFTATLNVTEEFAKNPGTGNYGIYTYSGSGAKAAQFETFTPISFAPKVVAPTVTVSKTEGLNAAGETVTVTGTGFVAGDATSGARPPLAGKFAGSYVVFGRFADAWKPSENAASASRAGSGDTKWAVPAADMAAIGGDAAGAIELNADGSFTATLNVTEEFAKNPGTGNYGIYTYSGSGAKAAQFETFTPITFAPKVVAPTVTVSKTTGLNAAGETVTVTGTGFLPTAETTGTRPPLAGKFTGAYVVFGRFADVWAPSANAPSASRAGSGDVKWAVHADDMATIGGAPAGAIEVKADGTFTATLNVTEEFAKNPGTGNYGIYTYGGGGAKYAPFESYTPITFAPKVATPTVTSTVAAASATDGLSVRLVGSGFGTTTAAYAAIIEKGTEASVDPASGFIAMEYWMPPAIVAGGFDKSLVAPTAALDRNKQYEVIIWKQHSLPNAGTIYARADITPTTGQWDTLFPAPQPDAEATTTTLSVDKTAVVEGSTVTATAVIAPVAASGTVNFVNGSTVVAKDVAVTGGTATASFKLAKTGSASLTAVFTPAKGALFLGSTSAAVAVAVTAKPVTPPESQTGELDWGVYSAFRDYITGPVAGGEITLSDGATAAGSGFQFTQAGGTVDLQAGKGSANYNGALRFTGHHGALDVTMSAPTLRLDSATKATLLVIVNGTRVEFATVNLAAAGTSTDKGKTLITDAPVTLSAAGATAFQGFYPAGTVIDPITVAFSTGATEPVETIGTRTALSVDKDSVLVGGSVKLSATVTPGTAQGSVIFSANGTQLGSAVRVIDGAASADAALRTVGSIALTARFVPDAGFGASSSAARTVTVTSSVLPPVKPPIVTPPTTPVVPPVVAPTTQGGSLSWGVGSVFREYIVGHIAKGSISVSGGATSASGVFQFGQSGGSFNQGSGTGTADYAGSVRFTGHGGILDLTFSNPTLSVSSASSASLTLTVNGSRVDFATVDLGAASRSSLNGATVFSGAPVTLTSAGAGAFQGYYPAGQALDPMTVTIGAAAAAPGGNTGTVATASANTPAAGSVPATPPATEGITLTPEVLAGIVAGGQISFEADGFQPNETGIRIVIYSTPTVLAENLTADANGVVRWTGTLPATLTGEHTLTVQGSISKGVVITIPERAVAGSCPIEGATLDWGFKQSFLAYISSGIANGGWELSGGSTEADGLFHWANGTGSIDSKNGSGLVSYLGSIRFTGHDGALDTTIANPRIELVSETEGYLVLDVTGTTQEGEPIAGQGLRFGQLKLDAGSLTVTDAGITGTAIEAVLTEAGAAAFGTYPAGDALDPISFTLPTNADCGVVAAEAVTTEATGPGKQEAASISADAAQGVNWVVWILAAFLAAALAVIVVLLTKRRRAGADTSAE
ncbi:HtaA domain-containing protein [Microterricola viridarii]|uniref:Htaa protein n=1 Tax=Microterricola viridarii TaxID=412690 RepID=A0A0Y0QD91_9MICO|nr:HtaA domain-containing protein [Microterricola viridarii]AMB60186.1 hypothetical protein AWU67_16475 [Microterricola viridarii]